MQLSAPITSPTDISLASLLAGGESSSTSSLPGSPVGEFAQLFPGLAPARAGLAPPLPAPAPLAPVLLAPALRTFTSPTATAPQPAVNAPAATAPAPLISSEETAPDLAPPPRPKASTAAKPSRPSPRPVVVAAPKAPVETSAATPSAVVVVPAPENLFVPPTPVATDLLASPQPTEDSTDELLAEHPPHEEPAAEEGPAAPSPLSTDATPAPSFGSFAPLASHVAPSLEPRATASAATALAAAPAATAPQRVAETPRRTTSAFAPAASTAPTASTAPVASAAPAAPGTSASPVALAVAAPAISVAVAPQSLPRAEFASRQFSSLSFSPAIAPLAAERPAPVAAPSLPAAVTTTPADAPFSSEAAGFVALDASVFRAFRPEVSPAVPVASFTAPTGNRATVAVTLKPTPTLALAPEAAFASHLLDSVPDSGPRAQFLAPAVAAPVASVPVVHTEPTLAVRLPYQASLDASFTPAPAFPAEFAPRPSSMSPSPLPLPSSEHFASTVTFAASTVTTAAPTSTPTVSASTASIAPATPLAASTPAPTTPVAPKAKFAARAEKFSAEKNSVISVSDKSFLNTDSEALETRVADFGTGVAKSVSVMPPASFSDRPTPAAVLPPATFAPAEHTGEIDFAPAFAAATVDTPAAPASVANAHRAVEAVLVAADRVSSGDQHSVNLQFSVGGTELTVRVELRADEVRATFRTDSPELREALSHEWQAAQSSSSSERSFRLAPPVITSANGDTSSSFSAFSGGDTPSRQRDTGAQHAEQNAFASLAAAARASLGSASAPLATSSVTSSTLAASPVTAARRGAQRLLAHA